MDALEAPEERYRPPTYEAASGAAWYHFLHGNVPGHQIDYIYQAKVPQGPLERQHFSHLTRLLRFIEPHSTEQVAFAIGNLSRDDVQHEPGHGGMALIFGLRIRGVVDHAGRQDPPFAHAIAAVDRALDYGAILELALELHKRVRKRSAEWYRDYVIKKGSEGNEAALHTIEHYLERFNDLPDLKASRLSAAWKTAGALPKRIIIAHGEDVDFGEIAYTAARIAAVLYRSDIRWTSISNGRERESDEPGKVTVRFLPASQVGSHETVVHKIGDLPEDEAGIAQKLFGAEPVQDTSRANPFPRRASRFEARAEARGEPRAEPKGESRAESRAEPRARQSDPGSVDIDIGMDDPTEVMTVPRLGVTPAQPPSQRPPPPHAASPSERPPADRLAAYEAIEVAIPAPSPLPDTRLSPAPAVTREPGPRERESAPREPVVAREPAPREPAPREPVAREPVAREPVAREPVAREPVAREPPQRPRSKAWIGILVLVLVGGVIALLAQQATSTTQVPTNAPSASAAPATNTAPPPVSVAPEATPAPSASAAPKATATASASTKPKSTRPASPPAPQPQPTSSSIFKRPLDL